MKSREQFLAELSILRDKVDNDLPCVLVGSWEFAISEAVNNEVTGDEEFKTFLIEEGVDEIIASFIIENRSEFLCYGLYINPNGDKSPYMSNADNATIKAIEQIMKGKKLYKY